MNRVIGALPVLTDTEVSERHSPNMAMRPQTKEIIPAGDWLRSGGA
jgi:hypothetical protein